jgi:hypothetical protein
MISQIFLVKHSYSIFFACLFRYNVSARINSTSRDAGRTLFFFIISLIRWSNGFPSYRYRKESYSISYSVSCCVSSIGTGATRSVVSRPRPRPSCGSFRLCPISSTVLPTQLSPRPLSCVYVLRRRFLPPLHLPVHTLLRIALARLILFPLFLNLPFLSLVLIFPIFEPLWPSFHINKSCSMSISLSSPAPFLPFTTPSLSHPSLFPSLS